MKKIGILILLPFSLAILSLWFLLGFINTNYLSVESKDVVPNTTYVVNFRDTKWYEDQFLLSEDSNEVITILGSSELTSPSPAIPYEFIGNHFNTKAVAVGHAGNQSFSMFCQLLANSDRLENAPILIMVSPGWFESSYADGTTSTLFLEYCTDKFISKIYNLKTDPDFQEYVSSYIEKYYADINNPDIASRLFHYKEASKKSIFHKGVYAPVIAFNGGIVKLKTSLIYKNDKTKNQQRYPLQSESVNINWDSLLKASQDYHLAHSNNNNRYIDNEYYSTHIKGVYGATVPVEDNQELRDFEMLVELLIRKKVNASFVLMPLNPIHYKDIKKLDPTIAKVRKTMAKSGFPVLDMWNSDPSKYDKGVLKDIMHLGDYGWYQVDRFIVETYKLQK